MKIFEVTFELFTVMTLPLPFPWMMTLSPVPTIVSALLMTMFPLYVPEGSFIVAPAGALSILSCRILAEEYRTNEKRSNKILIIKKF